MVSSQSEVFQNASSCEDESIRHQIRHDLVFSRAPDESNVTVAPDMQQVLSEAVAQAEHASKPAGAFCQTSSERLGPAAGSRAGEVCPDIRK